MESLPNPNRQCCLGSAAEVWEGKAGVGVCLWGSCPYSVLGTLQWTDRRTHCLYSLAKLAFELRSFFLSAMKPLKVTAQNVLEIAQRKAIRTLSLVSQITFLLSFHPL